MHQYLHLRWGDVNQTASFDYFESLVHQGGGVDGNPPAHAPGRMIERLLHRDGRKLRFGSVEERATGCSEPDAAHFVHASVGDTQSRESEPLTITVDELAKKEDLTKIEILHADIQGHEYAMLLGTTDLLKSKLVRFVFLSTHGFKIHAKCLGFLRKRRYKIIAEHTPGESYSVDGLIVACADWNVDKIKVTKKPQGIRDRTKSLACRYLSYFVG